MKTKSNIITLQELLAGRNEAFDKSDSKLLVRLSDNNGGRVVDDGKREFASVHSLYASDHTRTPFKAYVSEWSKETDYNVMKKHEYLIMMVAEEGVRSRLLKVYRVAGHTDNGHKLKLDEVAGFEALEGRVVAAWGTPSSTQQWKQEWRNEKEVVAIDNGIAPEPFASYSEVILSFDDLKNIIDNEYPEWKEALEKVNCIYCITDTSNGKLYIGSTYSSQNKGGGIWNRWKNYVETEGAGGNKELEQLSPEHRMEYLQWHILEVLDHKVKPAAAVEVENLYKKKFCTRKHGYNKSEGKKN